MAIRQDIVLDISKYKKSLNEADRAAIKYSRNAEKNFEKQKKALKSITTEINRLEAVREASNNPKAVRQYTQAIEKLEKEQKQLRKETQNYASAADKSSKKAAGSFKRMGRAAKMWISGTVIGIIMTLQSVLRDMGGEMMRFNEEMNKSLAIQGNVTMEQRNRMEKAAKEVSRELNMATDKVAQGYFYLASAGLDVEEQIANLPKVAEFAKAGMFDLATATDLATDAQSALGMTVENTAQNQRNLVRVTDVLTSANEESNATVQQFSESLTNKAGARLRSFNKDVEEGVAVLAAYADQGVKGQRAGEQLNILYRELARTYRENTAAFEEFGIQVFDQNGEMRNTADIIRDIEQALGGMSSEQRDATMAMLGFTSESQDAINNLIGASENIELYERNLRNAAGTTEEVANNQLNSLTERLGLLKRQLVDTFGDDVVSAIESTVNALESLYRAVRGTQEEIQKERVIEGALEDIGGLYGSDLSGFGFTNLRTELDKLYDSQRKNTEEFNRQNRELTETISSYSTWASEVAGAEEKVSSANEELLFREMVLEKNIQRNKELIDSEETSVQQKAKLIVKNQALNNKLSSVQEQISKTRDYLSQTTEEEKKQQDQVEGLANSYAKALSKFGEFEDHLNEIVSLGMQAAGSEGLGQLPAIIADVDEQFQKLASGDLSVAISDVAMGKILKYNRELTKLNNEYSAGIISQKEYERQLQKLSESFLDQLQEMYKSIKDNLTPAQQELWKEIFGNFDKGTDAAEDFKDNLSGIADMVDSIINVADAFGAIGDNARKSLSGISDVLRNVEKLKGESGLSAVIPAIGVAGGVTSMLSGFFTSKEEENRQAELVNSLKSLERAVERNTDAFYEQEVVGSDISDEQLQEGRQIVSGMDQEAGNINFAELIIDDQSSLKGIRNSLKQLGELFPEIFGDHLDMFNNLIEQGRYEEAMQLIASTEDRFREMESSVGEYGDSIQGAAKVFRDAIEYGGATVEEAFDKAADHILNNVASMEELDQEAINLIKEAKALDLGTEEGRERLKEIVQTLFENPQWRGDMTKEEWEQMMDLFKDASEGDGSVSGSEADGYSRSVQIARSITDVQANEMIMFLERIEKWTRDMAAGMGSKTAQSVNSSGGMMPSFDMQVPLPVTIVDDMPETNSITQMQRSIKKNELNLNGDINLGGDINEADIDDLTRRMARNLKRELRSKKF